MTAPRLGRRRAGTLTAYVIGGMLASTWGPRLPDLTRELHVTTGEIGAVLAVANLGLLAGLVVASPAARILGARRAVAVALAVIALCLGAAALVVAAGAVLPFAVVLTVLGFAVGALDVLINAEGAAIEHDTGRSFLPLLHALWLGGAAAGAAVGAACAGLGISAAMQAAGLAVFVVILGVGIVVSLPRAIPVPDEAIGGGIGGRGRARVWTDPRLIALGALIFGVELAEGSARTWIPLAVESGLHRSDAVAALFVTVFSITTAGFRAVSGPVVDRIGRIVVVRVTIAVGAVGVALFILGGSFLPVLIGTLLWAVGNSVAGPLAMSAAAEGGAGAAARIGVVSTIGFAAGLAGPPVIGLLAQDAGIIPALWLLVVAFAGAFAVSGALRPRDVPRPT
ncbi:MFS transporter [Pseudolysinimonas sp.]|uniref:MFS transporter n=1 Tax=Pseudolysinimonas sp. TaxID=2680009 RepID=UPI003F7D4E04